MSQSVNHNRTLTQTERALLLWQILNNPKEMLRESDEVDADEDRTHVERALLLWEVLNNPVEMLREAGELEGPS